MRPIILISSSGLLPGQTNLREADPTPARRDGVLIAYTRSVVLAGGAPVLLPNTGDAEATAAAVEAAAGLLLTGGGDVAPDLYGQPPHPKTSLVDPLRDRTEQVAIETALRVGRPILGICRGIQMLNVALGGTLIQDIPAWRAQTDAVAVEHGDFTHPIRLEAAGTLHSLWPADSFTVNTCHHQAVDRVAPSLRATAWAPDGIVEAVEAANGDLVLAVQCHPERLADKQDECLAVFRWLVATARE